MTGNGGNTEQEGMMQKVELGERDGHLGGNECRGEGLRGKRTWDKRAV